MVTVLNDGIKDVRKIAVFALLKNCEAYLVRLLFPLFEKVEASYQVAFSYYFLENGSDDKTRDVIVDFLKGRTGRFIDKIDRDFSSDAHKYNSIQYDRINKMAYLRNYLFDACHTDIVDADWILMVDTDIKFDPSIFANLFALEPAKNQMGMLSPYSCEVVKKQKLLTMVHPSQHSQFDKYSDDEYLSLNHYYDTFALVYADGYNTWPSCRFDKCALCQKRCPDLLKIPTTTTVLDVNACFGGFVLIDNSCLKNTPISWEIMSYYNADRLATCEHILFCTKFRAVNPTKRICIAQNVVCITNLNDIKIEKKAGAVTDVKLHDKDNTYLVIRISGDGTIQTLKSVSKDFIYRETVVLKYVKNIVAKYPGISGDYAFGLEDAYIEAEMFDSVFYFSKDRTIAKGTLVPDLYAMENNYAYKLKECELSDIDFDKKTNSACFVGCSTGTCEIATNIRLKFCSETKHSNIVRGYCSSIVQMKEADVKAFYLDHKNWLLNDYVNIGGQLQSKAVISIDGNTACWDRIVWILNSNSILFKQKSNHICWYYHLLQKDVHYKEFSMDAENWLEVLEADVKNMTSDRDACVKMVSESRAFVKKHLSAVSQEAHMVEMLKKHKNQRVTFD